MDILILDYSIDEDRKQLMELLQSSSTDRNFYKDNFANAKYINIDKKCYRIVNGDEFWDGASSNNGYLIRKLVYKVDIGIISECFPAIYLFVSSILTILIYTEDFDYKLLLGFTITYLIGSIVTSSYWLYSILKEKITGNPAMRFGVFNGCRFLIMFTLVVLINAINCAMLLLQNFHKQIDKDVLIRRAFVIFNQSALEIIFMLLILKIKSDATDAGMITDDLKKKVKKWRVRASVFAMGLLSISDIVISFAYEQAATIISIVSNIFAIIFCVAAFINLKGNMHLVVVYILTISSFVELIIRIYSFVSGQISWTFVIMIFQTLGELTVIYILTYKDQIVVFESEQFEETLPILNKKLNILDNDLDEKQLISNNDIINNET